MIKYCEDCKWFRKDRVLGIESTIDRSIDKCVNPRFLDDGSVYSTYPSVKYHVRKTPLPEYKYATDLRKPGGECGLEAVGFEPKKSFYQKLLNFLFGKRTKE